MTAVEWLKKELEKYGNPVVCEVLWEDFDSLVEQAKQMEKEQIIKSNRDGVDMVVNKQTFVTGDQYYKETYGS